LEGEPVRIHLGGHLNWYHPAKRAWLELDPRVVPLAGGDCRSDLVTPAAVAQYLGLPFGEIALVAVNGRLVDPAIVWLTPGDRVEFYPPIGGG
jgi:hypothetical protein